ncbi:DoxX family protein [Novosphingopyxis sp.]|uniref:DoxX family protein n=1 Tax=Novosphingopyxis sp. TaxID=2709690 RepID=UPI003B5CC9BB
MPRAAPTTPESRAPESRTRAAARWLLALAYLAAGVLHLARPAPFIGITPDWVPAPATVIALTGIAEILGAIGMLQPRSRPLRRAAGIALALYAVCVFPANINHMILDMDAAHPRLGWGYHVPRMFAQPLLVWLALWTGGATDWPFGRRRGS